MDIRHSTPQLVQFRQQLQALTELYPITAGSLVKQYVVCGKSGCRCQRGEKHGPLYYLYWKEEGRSRSLYIPRAKVAELRRQIQNYRRLQKELARSVHRQLREWQHSLQKESRR